MLFNLYKSEWIRLKFPIIVYFLISFFSSIVIIFLMNTVSSSIRHEGTVDDIFRVIAFPILIYLVLYLVINFIVPIYYVRAFFKNKEYFLSYPISNMQKYLLILSITFTMIIVCWILSILPVYLYYHSWISYAFSLTDLHEIPMFKLFILLVTTTIMTILFLINLGTLKWLIIPSLIVYIFYSNIMPTFGNDENKLVFMTGVNSGFNVFKTMINHIFVATVVYNILFSITLLIAGFYRISTLQLESNKYLLQYFGIILIGMAINTVVSYLV